MDAERTRRPGRCVRIGARYLPIEHVKQIAEAEHPRQSAVLCYSRQHRTWHNPTHTQRFVFYASYPKVEISEIQSRHHIAARDHADPILACRAPPIGLVCCGLSLPS